jgi:hypothetical protein
MKNLFLILCSLSVIICSCKKSSLDYSSAALKGRILLVDENNHPISDYSGVIITSENSDIANISIDVNGEFNFPGLANNSTYLTLNFSKTGYGTVTHYYTKVQLDSFSNQPSTTSEIVLLPRSSVTVNSLSGIMDGDKFKMVCNVSLAQVKPTNGVTFFLSKNNSQVSYDNCTGNNAHSRTWTVPVTSGDNLNSFCFRRTIDCDCDFLISGDTVFLKAYGDTYSPFGNSHFDIRTGQLIFPGINANASSSTISFVVP